MASESEGRGSNVSLSSAVKAPFPDVGVTETGSFRVAKARLLRSWTSRHEASRAGWGGHSASARPPGVSAVTSAAPGPEGGHPRSAQTPSLWAWSVRQGQGHGPLRERGCSVRPRMTANGTTLVAEPSDRNERPSFPPSFRGFLRSQNRYWSLQGRRFCTPRRRAHPSLLAGPPSEPLAHGKNKHQTPFSLNAASGTWFSAAATGPIGTKSRGTPLSCRAPSGFRGVGSPSTVAELGRGSGSRGGRETCRGAPWQVSLRSPTGQSRTSPESPALRAPAPHSKLDAAGNGHRQDEKGGH